jgi:HAD superfamily hydrolase (TIGR01509 family)
MTRVPPAPPVRGVLFDFHHTLVHGGDTAGWLRAAWAHLGRPGDPAETFGADHPAAVDTLDHIWEHARDLDPDNSRDLSPRRHREVWDVMATAVPGVDPELAGALYSTMPASWEAYADAAPVLQALRAAQIVTAMVSNVGYDLAPVAERTGMAPLLDVMVLSQAVGVVKPDPRIFQAALDAMGLPAADVLMVGDAWRDDAAAAALGMRTLVLPRTEGPVHGLELVLRVVGISPG